jgi:DNA-binding NarL/FixJ family response regulator
MRENIVSFLRQHNIQVLATAADGRRGMRRSLSLHVDLVLMDVQLPEMSGLEATRHIKAREGAPAIVIVTADDSPGCRAAAKAAGADGFVTKAGDLATQLETTIRKLSPRADL